MINRVAPAFLIPVLFSLFCIFIGVFLTRKDDPAGECIFYVFQFGTWSLSLSLSIYIYMCVCVCVCYLTSHCSAHDSDAVSLLQLRASIDTLKQLLGEFCYMSLFGYSSWDPNQCLEVKSGQGLVRAFPVSDALHLYPFIFCLKKILINTCGPKAIASLVYILEPALHICIYTFTFIVMCCIFG